MAVNLGLRPGVRIAMNLGSPLRVRYYLAALKRTLWFIPAVFSAVGCSLAVALLIVDFNQLDPDRWLWLLYTGDSASARDLVSTLLSGMITMTSLAVSITMVVLTLAAAQLGPRLVSNFIGDRATQAVLGLFVATILYLLIVLRTMNDQIDGLAVPHFSITMGSILAATSLFVLLFYVHRLARSTNADTIVEAVAADLQHRLESVLPEQPDEAVPPSVPPHGKGLSLGQAGYIQGIDIDRIVGDAASAGVTVYVTVRPGQFVLRGDRCVSVVPAGKCSDDLVAGIRAAIIVGPERTPSQDIEYGIRQLVEIALRALSTGVNDPFTAITVIDHLGAALETISTRGSETAVHPDTDGNVRLVRTVSDYDGLVDTAFDQIREASAGKPALLVRLMDALARVAVYAGPQTRRRCLREHVEKIRRAGDESIADPSDRDDLKRVYDRALEHLRQH